MVLRPGTQPLRHGSDSESPTMVETRIKPYYEQVAEEESRAEQTRRYRRNRVFGLLIIALAIQVWTLIHTNPKWIFPPGWWRL
jgi:hypothetical protein